MFKSPEKYQPKKPEDEPEGKEGLQSAIQTLREVAEQFNVLDHEADNLFAKEDTTGCTEKLKERAQLLVDLPDRLASSLESVDQETREQILRDVSYFATSAQEALENGGKFRLGVLLTSKGYKIGDKNDLEQLIDSLEG